MEKAYILTAKEQKMFDEFETNLALLGIEFMVEDNIIKVKWQHGDKHYIVPLGGLLELWVEYTEQGHK